MADDSGVGGMTSGIIERAFERGRQDYWKEQDQQWNEENQKREHGFQREMAQHGIRWRVEDAMAAGLHPLFALGAQLPGGSPAPISIGGVGEASAPNAHLPKSLTAAEHAATAQALKTQEALENKYDAEAMLARSQAMRLQQQGQGQPDSPTLLGPRSGVEGQAIPSRLQYAQGNVDAIEMVAPKVLSSRPGDVSATPGKQPGWQEVEMFDRGNGERFSIWLPASPDGEGWGESMEGVAPMLLALIKNVSEGKVWEAMKYIIPRLEYKMPRAMPPAQKEFSGSEKPWWWEQDGRGSREARRNPFQTWR